MPQQGKLLKLAEVDKVEYLNWPCANTIICKESEFRSNSDGTWYIERELTEEPLVDTLENLAEAVRARGWRTFWPTSKVWRIAHAKTFHHGSGIIAIRANGIDFQVLAEERDLSVSGNKLNISIPAGRFVRHGYHQSAIDLIELSLQFAIEIERPDADLDRFFTPVGTAPPKSARQFRDDGSDDLAQIRNAINGDGGGPAYLCDDVWI
jgi:hypothetical protein